MSPNPDLKKMLQNKPRKWLVTGAAGFIGSHLVEALLGCDQEVVGADNFLTGHRANLEDATSRLSHDQRKRFRFIEADICKIDDCRKILEGVDTVIHQAALGSVPRSIENPLLTHACNVDGFINMLATAKDRGIKRFVYASSSSVYGDEPTLPKIESRIGRPLSPYALSKLQNELIADVFSRVYGIECVGLRYFNVFGPRQDPNGPYAAVIPRWIAALSAGDPGVIYGDGKTTRDFTFIDNVVYANLSAATVSVEKLHQRVFNIACGKTTSLNELHRSLRDAFGRMDLEPKHEPARDGDIRDSLADTRASKETLGLEKLVDLREGLKRTVEWYRNQGDRKWQK